MKARVHITLKAGVLDPQGKAIAHALTSLGFAGVSDVRQGKYIELDLADTDAATAKSRVEAMCQRLLANTIVEDYKVELTP
ncbi:MAG TPA: phosphoribosylformylglycinamidine synthase subunit PurS [Candidatus Sulfotelmatobacter sp.]|nr:phosphoribosylformylglycinamidine synthase subunit PurS [Candidatus Sulfotelmatobacter sp.]